jgi:hypothetical protein
MIRLRQWFQLGLVLGVLLSPVCPVPANAAQASVPGQVGMETMQMQDTMGIQIDAAPMPCCAMHAAQEQASTRMGDVQPAGEAIERPLFSKCAAAFDIQFLFVDQRGLCASPPFFERSQSRRD